jgi:hypothetical protein
MPGSGSRDTAIGMRGKERRIGRKSDFNPGSFRTKPSTFVEYFELG